MTEHKVQSPFEEMLSILREHQANQLDMNRNLIEALPPEVKARIPDDAMMFLEYGFAFVYLLYAPLLPPVA